MCPIPEVFDAGELERIALIVVPAAQVDGVALAAAFGHTHDVDEKTEALFRLGGEKFQMAQVGNIHDWFSV